jgi:hypothetical protein
MLHDFSSLSGCNTMRIQVDGLSAKITNPSCHSYETTHELTPDESLESHHCLHLRNKERTFPAGMQSDRMEVSLGPTYDNH